MLLKLCRNAGLVIMFMVLSAGAKAECTMAGVPCQHRGFWNIYASMPGGDAWAADYTGRSPTTVRVTRQAEAIQARVKSCGVAATIANSSWVAGFRGDLVIVLSGPYPSSSVASYDLSAARQCGVNGYSKFGVMDEPAGE